VSLRSTIGIRSISRLRSAAGEQNLESAGMSRWLLTYADMITLLLVLFLILFSISTVDRVKVQRLVHDISGGINSDDAINNPPSGGSTGREPQSGARDAQLVRINSRLQAFVAMNALASDVKTRIDRRGLVITLLADRTLYASGSAELPDRTKRLLDEIDREFLTTQSHLRVEGNTDSVPIATEQYPTNWELSAARAIGVTRYLVETKGLSPMRVSLAGYGQYRPRVPHAQAPDRRYNRRVDIVILNAAMTKDDAAVQP